MLFLHEISCVYFSFLLVSLLLNIVQVYTLTLNLTICIIVEVCTNLLLIIHIHTYNGFCDLSDLHIQ